MAKFNTNQNRQFYVAKAYIALSGVDGKPGSELKNLLTNEGDITLGTTKDGEVFFQQLGKGGLVRSDVIDPKSVTDIKVTKASVQRRPLKKYKISLDSAVNSGAPVAGQDYVIQFQIANAFGGGMDDLYIKFGGSVYATTGMTASQFWAAMYKSVLLNFKRELNDWFEFDVPQASVTVSNSYTLTAKDGGTAGNSLKYTLSISGDAESVTVSDNTVAIVLTSAHKTQADLVRVVNGATNSPVKASLAGTATGASDVRAVAEAASLSGGADYITIKEKELSWKLGKMSDDGISVNFVIPTIEEDHVEVQWAKVEDLTPAIGSLNAGEYVGNGKKTADMEYFFHGERGDQYRDSIGDQAIPTEYMVDPTKEYDFLDIHFAYQGSCEDIQKSEKDITIVWDTTTYSSADLDDMVTALASALGVTIPVVPAS